MSSAILVLASLLLGGVAVEGGGSCPEPAAVVRHLEALAPEATGTARLSASNEGLEEGLVVELLDGAGRLLARKALRADRPCDELARASALFLATWLRHPRAAVSGPELPVPPPPPSTPLAWTVGVGAVAAADRLGLTPGAVLQGQVGVGAWSVDLGVTGLWRRQFGLGPGTVDYRSLALQLGVGHAWDVGGWALSLHGAAAGALFFLDGKGFDSELQVSVLAPGVALGVRLERPLVVGALGAFVPWVGLGGVVWVREVRAVVEGIEDRRALPQWDFSLALGVGWGGGR